MGNFQNAPKNKENVTFTNVLKVQQSDELGSKSLKTGNDHLISFLFCDTVSYKCAVISETHHRCYLKVNLDIILVIFVSKHDTYDIKDID